MFPIKELSNFGPISKCYVLNLIRTSRSQKGLITKARKEENTKKNELNFVFSKFGVFVMKMF